jgi:predicted patatin/cPLA2 family phospholipase
MNQPLVKRSLAELDTVIEEIIQRNPEWYEEIQQLIEESKNEKNILY